ncbi:MAG: outer membrane lipoprotein-sorting protein [Verrucomicrobia bacterium]|nr:outer membrane lipoprotein-sorting protein [Verrucomicrobiota bacterium]
MRSSTAQTAPWTPAASMGLPTSAKASAFGMSIACLLLAVLCPLNVHAEPAAGRLSADDIMSALHARLPRETLLLDGDLVVRRRHGAEARELGFRMELAWGAMPQRSTYLIFDALGGELEKLTINRRPNASTTFAYQASGGDDTNTMPPLYTPIQGSDVTWIDLSLAYLWWRDGTVSGEDVVRGRDCYLVDLPAPVTSTDGIADPHPDTLPYASVRLWVDQELFMMLRAEGRDASGNPIRTLWVKSLKKMDDRWMIKDMEIQAHPTTQRTRLHIRDVSVATAPADDQEVIAPS